MHKWTQMLDVLILKNTMQSHHTASRGRVVHVFNKSMKQVKKSKG
jgi:hypothetical protein